MEVNLIWGTVDEMYCYQASPEDFGETEILKCQLFVTALEKISKKVYLETLQQYILFKFKIAHYKEDI